LVDGRVKCLLVIFKVRNSKKVENLCVSEITNGDLMAGASNNSDDDFKNGSPPLSQKLVRKNQRIPMGHILASLKWRNTSVVQKMTGIYDDLILTNKKKFNYQIEPLKIVREHKSFVCF
jgi:hypothetical protein